MPPHSKYATFRRPMRLLNNRDRVERRMFLKKLVITATLIVIALAAYDFSKPALLAQETITGDWTAKVRQTDKGPRLWLTLNSSAENGKHRFNSSFELP